MFTKLKKKFIPKWNRFVSDIRSEIAWLFFRIGSRITDASCHSCGNEWIWKRLKK